MGFIQDVGGNPIDKLVDKIGAVTSGKNRIKGKVQDVKNKPRDIKENLKSKVRDKVVPSGEAVCNKLGHKVRKGDCPRCGNRIR